MRRVQTESSVDRKKQWIVKQTAADRQSRTIDRPLTMILSTNDWDKSVRIVFNDWDKYVRVAFKT